MQPWMIGGIVLAVLAIGAVAIWFLLLRRPTKLDPRHEQLVQNLAELLRTNPREGHYVIARTLVRHGLIWESDLQRMGVDTASGPAPARSEPQEHRKQQNSRDRRDDGGDRSDNRRKDGGRRDNRNNRRSSGSRDNRGSSDGNRESSDKGQKGGDGQKPDDASTEQRSAKRRRRRRPRRKKSNQNNQQNQQNQSNQSNTQNQQQNQSSKSN